MKSFEEIKKVSEKKLKGLTSDFRGKDEYLTINFENFDDYVIANIGQHVNSFLYGVKLYEAQKSTSVLKETLADDFEKMQRQISWLKTEIDDLGITIEDIKCLTVPANVGENRYDKFRKYVNNYYGINIPMEEEHRNYKSLINSQKPEDIVKAYETFVYSGDALNMGNALDQTRFYPLYLEAKKELKGKSR